MVFLNTLTFINFSTPVMSDPVMWAAKDDVAGIDMGHADANAVMVGNTTVNGSEAVAFVQLIGGDDRHARTVVMMNRYENHTIPYMFYQQGKKSRLEFDWLLISPDATRNEFLQFGSFDMQFHSVEKCHHVSFNQVFCYSKSCLCSR